MSARVLSFFRPAPATSGDWSQQELAEFYRVEAASLQAGLRLSLERGLSDEGDPWLVFCREDGEVFLHFARVDGSYVIVSDMVGEPLVGPDFRALLAELVARNPSVLPIHRDAPGGTGARSGAQVLMHPAALLAAIVATTCLFSTMNEAVASELDSGPLLPRQPTDSALGHHGFEPVSAVAHEPGEGDPTARTRAGEQRELAVATSVVMACIASFLDHSTSRDETTSANTLKSAETLIKSGTMRTETATPASAEQKAGSQAAQDARWAAHQEDTGEQPLTAGNATLAQVTPREAGAILLSTPGASIVTLGPESTALLAKGNAFEGAAPLQFVFLTTPGTVRLVAAHAGDAAAAPAKAMAASVGSAAGSGASVGLESSAAPSAASDGGHSSDASHLVGAEKASGSAPVVTGNGSAVASSSAQATSAGQGDVATKVIQTGAGDAGSSVAATTNKVAAGSTLAPTLTSVDTASGKSLIGALQDNATLSAKTVSLFLHNLIGDSTKTDLTGDAAGSSTSTDLVGLKGVLAGTINLGTGSIQASGSQGAPDTASTSASSSLSSSVSKIVASATSPVTDSKSASDSAHSDLSASSTKLPADAAHSAVAADAAAAITKVVASAAQVVTGAGSATSSQEGGIDLAQHVGSASGSVAATPPAAASVVQSAIGTATGTAGATTNVVTGSTSAPAQSASAVQPSAATLESEHTDALHAVSALVSSSNTVTKAISLSLTTGLTPLDAAQLRIIDAFMAATPNLEIRATATSLEIYDLSAINDPSISAMTWDLGGGSVIKIVGISDGHHIG